MNKTSIKIIKRKDARVVTDVETQDLFEPEQTKAYSEKKTERRLHRKMGDTVSDWIAEQRENKRVEEISAIQRMFGGESLVGKTV